MIDYRSDVDRGVLGEIQEFWQRLDARVLYALGVRDSYEPAHEALGLDVEYFHYSICADARYKFLGENLVMNADPVLTQRNKLCNAVITHLYGGRRIHTLFTGVIDPQRSFVDFERMLKDQSYVEELRETANYAKSHGYKFYGTTELHTSLQTAGRDYCRKRYGEPTRAASVMDILEWVAGWIESGLVDKLINAQSLKETYTLINTLRGVGPYYGYHLGVDCSLFHFTRYNHSEPFCVPGPGCRETVDKIFPNLSKQKGFNHGEAVVWIAENQRELFPTLTFHEALWNIEADGKKLFPFEQDKLMTYGTEVGLCQFGIWCRLRDNPHLIENRKCGTDPDLTPIARREAGTPMDPPSSSRRKEPEVNQQALCLLEF